MNKEFIDDYVDDFYPPKKEPEIKIPDYITKKEIIPDEMHDMEQAVLNNVPNNTDIEKQNHLKQLEEVATNYSVDEWNRVLFHAPSSMMADELKRRLVVYEDYTNNQRNNIDALTSQKL